MRRRSPKAGTPLNEQQKALSRQENELREKMQKLEEVLERASAGGSRLDVSIALNDKRFSDGGRYQGRRTSLRKERREGRIVFLVLVLALVAAVIWLVTHLPF